MIYLFSNEGYGKAFIRSVQQYSSTHLHSILLVFSAKNIYPRNRMRRSIRGGIRSLMNYYSQIRLRHRWKIPVLFVEDVNASRFSSRISHHDFGIIAGFNQIFRKELIEKFGLLVNFHPSLLPLYRGPVPSYWCIKNQEEKSGYTLHTVTERIDCGDILFQKEVLIGGIDDPDELDRKIALQASETLCYYLDALNSGRRWEKVQLDAYKIYKRHVDYASFPNRR
jgi:methionyl-tRNA formyltransferase